MSERKSSNLGKILEAWLRTAEYTISDDDECGQEKINLVRDLLSCAGIKMKMKAADGYFDPLEQQVYWYARHHADGYPTTGFLNFDEKLRGFVLPSGCDTVFIKRESVDKYIKSRQQQAKPWIHAHTTA